MSEAEGQREGTFDYRQKHCAHPLCQQRANAISSYLILVS